MGIYTSSMFMVFRGDAAGVGARSDAFLFFALPFVQMLSDRESVAPILTNVLSQI